MSNWGFYRPFLGCSAAVIALVSPMPCHGRSDSTLASPSSGVQAKVLNQLQVGRFTLQGLKPLATPGELQISLLLEGAPHQIVLRKHSLRAPGFRVRVQQSDGALHDMEVPDSETYRGYVAGYGSSRVSASITEGRVRAVVCLGDPNDSTWVIEPLQTVLADAAPEQHVVYNSKEVLAENGICGNADRPATKAAEVPLPAGAEVGLDVMVCRIACDADYEYFGLNGSSMSNTVADIEMIINGMSAIYERDTRITFQITQIIVRSAEPDPYTSGTASGLLNEFRLEWRNNQQGIPRDVAHLFTGKSFGTTLGMAYEDQICPGLDHYSLVRSRSQTDLAKRIALSAHEIGHNFDASHCDYDSDPRCRIMCPGLGGCSNGYNSFEDSNVYWIRACVARSSCLAAGTVTPPTTTLPFADNFDSINYPPQTPNPAKWTAVDRAECQYKHLEIKIGRGYSNNQQLGTVRTLPMRLTGAAQVQYKVNAQVPAGQAFKIEYLDSATFTWKTLRTITSYGTNGYCAYVDTVPAAAAGDYFAVRFSAYATAYTSSTAWYVDDVSIVQSVAPPQLAIARTATNTVVISWPLPAPDWKLEAADLLGAATSGWTLIAPPYPTNETQSVVTEPAPLDRKFYRLRAP